MKEREASEQSERAKLSGTCSGFPLLTHAFAGVPLLSLASLARQWFACCLFFLLLYLASHASTALKRFALSVACFHYSNMSSRFPFLTKTGFFRARFSRGFREVFARFSRGFRQVFARLSLRKYFRNGPCGQRKRFENIFVMVRASRKK